MRVDDEVVEHADDLIDQEGELLRRFGAGGAGLEALPHLGAAGGERAPSAASATRARGGSPPAVGKLSRARPGARGGR